jgi:hypothetical protein
MSLLLDTVITTGPHAGSTMRECIVQGIRAPIEISDVSRLELPNPVWESLFTVTDATDATDDAQESAR